MKRGILEKFRLAVTFSMALFMSACLAPPTATPPPTLQPVKVALSPSLMPMRAALNACASAQPEIALILSETALSSLDSTAAELTLQFGHPQESSAYAVPLAKEDIHVIVNSDNPVSAISTKSLEAIFDGQIEHWKDVGGEDLRIEVWILPKGDEFTQVFQHTILDNKPFSSLAQLAPDPGAMVEAIRADPAAIGFLPGAWLSENVRSLRVENKTRKALQQPILALSNGKPEGVVREFLHCLQSGEGHGVILEGYQGWE